MDTTSKFLGIAVQDTDSNGVVSFKILDHGTFEINGSAYLQSTKDESLILNNKVPLI